MQTSNPIYKSEMAYQRRNPLNRTVSTIGLLATLAILILVPLTLIDLGTAVESTVNLVFVTLWVVHAMVAVRCLIAGVASISREHDNHTWESLVMTGVPIVSILWGKYRAALRRIAPWVVGLAVVRMALLPVLMVAVTARLAFFYGGQCYSTPYGYPGGGNGVCDVYVVRSVAIFGVLMAILLTIVEGALCVAIGMAAGAILKRGPISLMAALLARFVPVAVLIALTRYDLGTNSFLWYRVATFAFADGGTSQLYQFIVPVSPWTWGRVTAAFPLSWLVAGSMAFVTLLTLAIIWLAILLRGALRKDRTARLSIRWFRNRARTPRTDDGGPMPLAGQKD